MLLPCATHVHSLRPSLSLHYSGYHPLKIVRGEGPFLFDENDQPYLDCINNVAIGEQMSIEWKQGGSTLSCLWKAREYTLSCNAVVVAFCLCSDLSVDVIITDATMWVGREYSGQSVLSKQSYMSDICHSLSCSWPFSSKSSAGNGHSDEATSAADWRQSVELLYAK